mgnify:FL=1
MRTIRLTIAATETHCAASEHGIHRQEGRCAKMLVNPSWCSLFERSLIWDDKPLRLPECIAAEKEDGK